MLSNCILSMSTTSLPPLAFYPVILPSCILPTSLSFHSFFFLFYSYLPSPLFVCQLSSVSLPLSWLHPYLLRLTCFPRLAPCTPESGDTSLVCVWNQEIKGSLSHIFHSTKDFCLSFNASESRLMCQFAQWLCHYFPVSLSHFLSLCTHCPSFCVISQHCLVSVSRGIGRKKRERERDRPSLFHSRLACSEWTNEWDQDEEREGIVGNASSAGRGSFKRLWSRRRGREGRESELKRGWMTFSALHTQISGKFLQFAGCCSARAVEGEECWSRSSYKCCDRRSRPDNLGMWVTRLCVHRGDL